LDKDTITGWAKLPRSAPGGFKPSKWQDRIRWDQDDKQDWEKSFPKDNPKEVDEDNSYTPPKIDIGDEVKVGKFKNRKAEVQGFSKDDHNQPVLKTNKGDQKLFKPRISKLENKVDEAEFNPNRRGFLKKAGAVAASAAMPKGLAGAAMKTVTPAAAVMSKAVSIAPDVFAGLSKLDFDDMLGLLEMAEIEHVDRNRNEPYRLDIIRKIANDAAKNEWGNAWFMNGNSAQSLINIIDKCKEWQKSTKISDDDIIKNIKHIVQDRFEKAPGEEDGRFRSANTTKNPEHTAADLEKATTKSTSDTSTGMSSLARAAGAQIGNTMKNVGKATANTILNQPAKDMGKIEPTTSPIALPAPTMKHGMQIPKQKSKVSAHQKDDENDKELERLKEMLRRA
jgi:hypothetical protein